MKIYICEVLTIKENDEEELEAFTTYEKAMAYGEAIIHGKEEELTYRIYPREIKE